VRRHGRRVATHEEARTLLGLKPTPGIQAA
jgi:hypothetical protein